MLTLKNPFLVTLFALGGIVLAWWIYLQSFSTHQTTLNFLFNGGYGLLYLLGAVVGLRGAFKFSLDKAEGKGFLFLGLSLLFYAIGQYIWLYYNLVLLVDSPFPSLADIPFTLFYPFAAFGLWELLKTFESVVSPRMIWEGVAILALSAGLTFFVFNKPDLSPNTSLIERFFNIAYPLGDTLLITLALVSLRIYVGKIYAGFRILIVGLTIETVADFIFLSRSGSGTYWNGDLSDLLYSVGAFLITLGLFYTIQAFSKKVEVLRR